MAKKLKGRAKGSKGGMIVELSQIQAAKQVLATFLEPSPLLLNPWLSESLGAEIIVKVFLHISKDEQRERLQERLADPDKQWKFDANDVVQRQKWDDYQRAYEQALAATDCDHAPWYVVPANSKTQRDLVVASILLETLEGMKLAFPPADPTLTTTVIE